MFLDSCFGENLEMNQIRTNNTQSPLATKSFLLAIEIVKISKKLLSSHEFVLSKQLLRSGTAPGALLREAKNAESLKDFIHKLSIAQKEADETLFWLDLLFETDYLEENDYKRVFFKTTEIMKMLTSALVNSKKKLKTKKIKSLKTQNSFCQYKVSYYLCPSSIIILLIKKGGGTGPMKPWQPAEILERCQFLSHVVII